MRLIRRLILLAIFITLVLYAWRIAAFSSECSSRPHEWRLANYNCDAAPDWVWDALKR